MLLALAVCQVPARRWSPGSGPPPDRSRAVGISGALVRRQSERACITAVDWWKLDIGAVQQRCGMSGRPSPDTARRPVIAGFLAGAVPVFVVHPLDLIRVRFQSLSASHLRQLGTLGAASHVVRHEGGFRSMYQGLTPSLVGNTVSWGLYFFLFDRFKRWNREALQMPYGPLNSLIAGTQAGSLTTLVSCPIWLVKTRMQLSRRYNGFLSSIALVAREEGIRGLYAGLVPGLWLVSHGAIQFMAYDEMLSLPGFATYSPFGWKSTAAVLSKVIAMAVTYPFQVVKTRLQDVARSGYDGFFSAMRTMYQSEGLAGFYRGFVPSSLRLVPQSALTIVLYEVLSARL